MKVVVFPLLLCAAGIFCGCASNSVINSSYDLRKIKRIGVAKFDCRNADIAGVENLFAKYLLENGFSVVERARLEKVLEEQKISVQGYFSPETAKAIGRVLGVDALLLGEVFSYNPGKEDIAFVETHNVSEEPVYRKELQLQPDGAYAEVIRPAGVKVTKETTKVPHVYTIYTQIGLIAKLVDIETGEIVWVGSYVNEGVNALSAAEVSARYLMKSFHKDWEKALKMGGKN